MVAPSSGSREPSARSTLDHAHERTRGWIAIALFAPLSVGVLIAVLALCSAWARAIPLAS
jgi:hypothetical protein